MNIDEGVFTILLGAFLVWFSSWAIGRAVFHRLRELFSATEAHLLGAVTGSAMFSLLTFVLGLFGCAYAWVFVTVALFLAAMALVLQVRGAPASGQVFPVAPPVWRGLLYCGYAAFGFYYLINALAPETSSDGMAYHLGTVAQYARQHRVGPIPHNVYAMLSQGGEMLFLPAFLIGGHSSAAVVHLTFLFVLAELIRTLGAKVRAARGWCDGRTPGVRCARGWRGCDDRVRRCCSGVRRVRLRSSHVVLVRHTEFVVAALLCGRGRGVLLCREILRWNLDFALVCSARSCFAKTTHP